MAVYALDARYRFALPAILPAYLQAEISAVPGVWLPGHPSIRNPIPVGKPAIDAPLNAGWLVEQWCAARGVSAYLKKDTVWSASEDDVRQSLALSEVRPEFADLASPAKFAKDYQANAIVLATQRGGGHLWMSPGAGKTLVMALWAFGAAMNPSAPCLFLTRKGPRYQFAGQLERFADVDPFIIEPPSMRRKRDRSLEAYMAGDRRCARPVLVLGWGSICECEEEILGLLKGGFSVVFDEAHTAKQPSRATWSVDKEGKPEPHAKRSTTASAARIAEAASRRLAGTGTPIRHRPWDLWGQLTLVECQAWGMTATKFKMRYCEGRMTEDRGLQADGLSNPEELKARLSFSGISVSYKVSHASLPPKRRELVRVPAGAQRKKIGDKQLEAELKSIAVASGESQAALAARARHAELQRDEAEARKVPFIVEFFKDYLLSGTPLKYLILCNRIAACEYLGKELGKIGAKAGATVWVSHGESHQGKEREAIRLAYMAHPGPCMLIGTWQAWGESFDLHDTDICGVAAMPLTPGEADQLEGRSWRLGALRNTLYFYFFAEYSIDEGAAKLLKDKLVPVEIMSDGGSSVSGMGEMFKRTAAEEEDLRLQVLASFAHVPEFTSDDKD